MNMTLVKERIKYKFIISKINNHDIKDNILYKLESIIRKLGRKAKLHVKVNNRHISKLKRINNNTNINNI